MQIELLENKKGLYEIWCDKDCIKEIWRNVNEPMSSYKVRAEREFEQYVESMRRLQSGGPKKIKSITI